MKRLQGLSAPPIFFEITPDALLAFNGERTIQVALDRTPNGLLTETCSRQTTQTLQAFINRKSWQLATAGVCAIGARGVSLRLFTIPAAKAEETERLLALQIENEFPLPPDELAWGACKSGEAVAGPAPGKQSMLVAAVKKEVVEQYAAIFAACGITPIFTIAALARTYLVTPARGSVGFVEIGKTQSELITFENGAASVLRVIPWGSQQLTNASAEDPTSIECLAALLNEFCSGGTLYLSGTGLDRDGLKEKLQRVFGRRVQCELLPREGAQKLSAAIAGLMKCQGDLPMQLRTPTVAAKRLSKPLQLKKQVVAVAGMLVMLAALPYFEALLLKPHLAKQLATIQADKSRLGLIDRELSFLQNLKQSQPPYLDALYLFSKAAPQGSRIDSLAMNRKGEVSLRGSLRDAQQVSDFRSKLIDSGFFSSVVVEEQAPTPDRQKLNIRMTAQWKSASDRLALLIGPSAEELAKDKSDKSKLGSPPGVESKREPRKEAKR